MIRHTVLFLMLVSLCCFKAPDRHGLVVLQNNSEVREGVCAVFVAPTAAQLDTMKAHMKESDFYSMTDDYMYYMSTARAFLQSKNVPLSNVDASGTIRFRKADGKIFEQKLSDLKWAVILFNGKSDPILANMVSIENDYQRYMK